MRKQKEGGKRLRKDKIKKKHGLKSQQIKKAER